MLEIRKLSKVFGQRVALTDVSLSIPQGRVLTLLGPSGSGKSTLLRIIAGLETADGGDIFWQGQSLQHQPPHERHMAFLSQRPALTPGQLVAESLVQGLIFAQSRLPRQDRLSTPAIDQRVRETAELLEITSHLSSSVETLSGGEQQRVAFGRAIVRQAPIWLLDEPFASLDLWLAQKLSDVLHLLQRRFSLTIIMVTHNPNEAMSRGDRVGVLGGSHLLQTGIPAEVHDRPGHRTVAFLFGQPNINFVSGSVIMGSFTMASCSVPIPIRLPEGAYSLGIYPRDLQTTATATAICLGPFRLNDRRRYGPGWLIACQRDALMLNWYTEAEPKTIDDTITLWIEPNRCHWFDPAGWRREPEFSRSLIDASVAD